MRTRLLTPALILCVSACGEPGVGQAPICSIETDRLVPLELLVGPCEADDVVRSCQFNTLTFRDREIHWQVPAGSAGQDGWPVAIVFQGSLYTAEKNWAAEVNDLWGGWNQVALTQALLDGGYAVVTPETRIDGGTYWDTNIVPWADDWEHAPDHQFMLDLFRLIEDGEMGPLDACRLYASGISSGGYMTSRMAVAYPGTFRALAVQSGSYATCAGLLCDVPDLPADHPPTLLSHGELDTVVPYSTAVLYGDALRDAGIEVSWVVDPDAGHEWLDEAPDAIVAWFDAHP